jgi:hypothetical protein
MREHVWRSEHPIRHRRICLVLLMALFICMLLPVRSHAEANKGKWVNKKDKYYYYNAKGKRLHGIQKIGKYTYYLDSKGVQRTGWRKVGKKYYYFQQSNGSAGYTGLPRVKLLFMFRKRGRPSGIL